jgi:serine protease Do
MLILLVWLVGKEQIVKHINFGRPQKVLLGALLAVAMLFAGAGLLVAGGSSEQSGRTVVIQEAPPVAPREAAPAGSDLSVAESLQNAFNSAASKALPVVVEVNVTEVVRQNASRSVSPFDFFFGQTPGGQGQGQEFQRQGLGSGVIVGRDADTVYVLTNFHVAGSASEIQIRLYDKREFVGKFVGGDSRMDLALVSFKTTEQVPIAVLGNSDNLRVGDWVIAVGNPYGFESSVTAGIVSALGRRAENGSGIADLTDYIQTDASINSGNSGGALLNLRGEVVGINTWIASQSGGSIGIGFAIPANNAKSSIKELIETGKIVYGWLGVSIGDPSPQTLPGVVEDLKLQGKQGSLVINVYKGSPADKGGLLPGDYVVKVGDTAIRSSQQLTETVARLKPGADLPLTVIRQGAEQKLTVRITARLEEDKVKQQAGLWPGVTVIQLTDAIRTRLGAPQGLKGLLVAGVDETGVAAAAGLKGGDVLVEMNGAKMESIAEFYRVLNDAKARELSLRVNRQGTEATVALQK